MHSLRLRIGIVLTAGLLLTAIVPATASAATFATTDPAGDVHHRSAVLNGHFDPDGASVTDCYFEWGTSTAYSYTAPCGEGTAFTTAEDVSAHISAA